MVNGMQECLRDKEGELEGGMPKKVSKEQWSIVYSVNGYLSGPTSTNPPETRPVNKRTETSGEDGALGGGRLPLKKRVDISN